MTNYIPSPDKTFANRVELFAFLETEAQALNEVYKITDEGLTFKYTKNGLVELASAKVPVLARTGARSNLISWLSGGGFFGNGELGYLTGEKTLIVGDGAGGFSEFDNKVETRKVIDGLIKSFLTSSQVENLITEATKIENIDSTVDRQFLTAKEKALIYSTIQSDQYFVHLWNGVQTGANTFTAARSLVGLVSISMIAANSASMSPFSQTKYFPSPLKVGESHQLLYGNDTVTFKLETEESFSIAGSSMGDNTLYSVVGRFYQEVQDHNHSEYLDELAIRDIVNKAIASSGVDLSEYLLSEYLTSSQVESSISQAISGIDLSGFATSEAVSQAISQAISGIDLSSFMTAEQIEAAINQALTGTGVDLSDYSTTSQIETLIGNATKETAASRKVSDTEKAAWNEKADSDHTHDERYPTAVSGANWEDTARTFYSLAKEVGKEVDLLNLPSTSGLQYGGSPLTIGSQKFKHILLYDAATENPPEEGRKFSDTYNDALAVKISLRMLGIDVPYESNHGSLYQDNYDACGVIYTVVGHASTMTNYNSEILLGGTGYSYKKADILLTTEVRAFVEFDSFGAHLFIWREDDDYDASMGVYGAKLALPQPVGGDTSDLDSRITALEESSGGNSPAGSSYSPLWGLTTDEDDYINDFSGSKENLDFEIASPNLFVGWLSIHNNDSESRRMNPKSRYLFNGDSLITWGSKQTSPALNALRADINYRVPDGCIMTGLKTNRSGNDSVWNAYYRTAGKVVFGDEVVTDFLNPLDQTFDYAVPRGCVLTGFQSTFDLGTEDRRFKLVYRPITVEGSDNYVQGGINGQEVLWSGRAQMNTSQSVDLSNSVFRFRYLKFFSTYTNNPTGVAAYSTEVLVSDLDDNNRGVAVGIEDVISLRLVGNTGSRIFFTNIQHSQDNVIKEIVGIY